MIDCNENVTSPEWKRWCRSLGLRNSVPISTTDEHLPPTFHKGRHSIDGIFVSGAISVKAAGYLPFVIFPSDHRLIWLDVTFQNIFGHYMPRLYHAKARRLKSDNPKVANRFIQLYSSFIKKHHIHNQIFDLEKQVTGKLSDTQRHTFDKILQLRYDGIRHANRICKKLCFGGVPFSEEVWIARKK